MANAIIVGKIELERKNNSTAISSKINKNMNQKRISTSKQFQNEDNMDGEPIIQIIAAPIITDSPLKRPS
jgi:hypothetical protein